MDELQDMVGRRGGDVRAYTDDLFIQVPAEHAGQTTSAVQPKLDVIGARINEASTTIISGANLNPEQFVEAVKNHIDNKKCLGAMLKRLLGIRMERNSQI